MPLHTIYIPVHQSINLSICLNIHRAITQSVNLSICINLSFCLSTYSYATLCVCVCVCGNPVTKDFESYSLILSIAQLLRWTIRSRGLAAYSVMPANEASGIGGRSYGRIALYLQEVSLDRFVLHYNNSRRLETLRFFLVKIKTVAIIREVKRSSRCF